MVEKQLWIPVREMVPSGSIGEGIVAEIPTLAERTRPETSINQPTESFMDRIRAGMLAGRKIYTMGDLLKLPPDKVRDLPVNPDRLIDKMQAYLEGLLITPHGRLIKAFFNRVQIPVPVPLEQEIIRGVTKIVDDLGDPERGASRRRDAAKDAEILRLQYGLEDGIMRTDARVGAELGIHSSAVAQKRNRNYRLLSGHPYLRRLEDFLTVPEDSFGRQVYQAILARDIPYSGKGHFIELSLAVKDVLEKVGVKDPYSSDLVLHDLRQTDLPEWVRNEVIGALRAAENKEKREVEERVQWEVKQEQARAERLGSLRNNLIPQVNLTPGQLKYLDQTPITQLDLSARIAHSLKRADIRTVGEFLRMSISDVLGVNNIGSGSVKQIEAALARMFHIDAEKMQAIREGWAKELRYS